MRPLLACLLAILFALPAALAQPVTRTSGLWVGVASQGSADHADDWERGPVGCTDSLTPFTLTLALLTGAPGDRVEISAVDVHGVTHAATAALGAPATIDLVRPDGCPGFTVAGVSVASEAAYAVRSGALPP